MWTSQVGSPVGWLAGWLAGWPAYFLAGCRFLMRYGMYNAPRVYSAQISLKRTPALAADVMTAFKQSAVSQGKAPAGVDMQVGMCTGQAGPGGLPFSCARTLEQQ